jgi:toxin YoeB
MAYVVYLSEQAKTELATIKRSGDNKTIKKIANLLIELQEHPRTGTGQVEHLKHFVYEETWSRRINKQYRMIYEIHDLEIYVSVVSLRSHYGDK